MTIHVGFTGTQAGMTDEQKAAVDALFDRLGKDAVVVHHGDCVGADEDCHDLADNHMFDVEIHPPTNDLKRAFCHSPIIHRPKDYLERNRDIVNATEILIACPRGSEVRRSGTWSTIRYARTRIYSGWHQTIYIIDPSGEVRHEGRGS